MRRFVFYFAVALFNFGIGTFIVLQFCRETGEKPIVKQVIDVTNKIQPERNREIPFGVGDGTGYGIGSGTSDRRFNQFNYISKLHLTCSDKKLISIWNELKKDEEFKNVKKICFRKRIIQRLLKFKRRI